MDFYLRVDFLFAAMSFMVVLFASTELGRVLISSGIFAQAFIGVIALATILGPLTYFNASMLRPAAITVVIIMLVVKVGRLARGEKYAFLHPIRDLSSYLKINLRSWLWIFISMMLSIFLLRGYLPDRYIFETHDVMYLGWLDGFWHVHQTGPLLVNTAYPRELGALHVLPSVLVATLGIFSPVMNLIIAQFLKTLFLMFFFSYLFRNIFTISRGNWLGIFSFFCIFTLVAGPYIGYSLGMSSYLYVLILLMICMNVIWSASNRSDLWVLFMFLILAKAPIMLIAVASASYLFIRVRVEIPKATKVITVAIIAAGVGTWFFGGASVASVEGKPSLLGILPNVTGTAQSQKFYEWIRSFGTLNNWMIDYFGRSIFPKYFEQRELAVVNFIWIVVSIYLTYVFALKILRSYHSTNFDPISLTAVNIYMLSSLLGVVFIRNGPGATIAHQLHAFFLAAVVAGFFLGAALLASKNKALLVTTIVTSIILITRIGYFPLYKITYIIKAQSTSAITLQNNKSWENSLELEIFDEVNPNTRTQVAAAMLGISIPWSEAQSFEGSQMNRFLKVVK